MEVFPHEIRAVSKNLETGKPICAICDVELVPKFPDDPDPLFNFLGAVDDRPCIAPLSRRLLDPFLQRWYIFLIFVTQTPRIAYNRLHWWTFGDLYKSNCWSCDGSGHEIVMRGDTGERVKKTCSVCNGYHG